MFKYKLGFIIVSNRPEKLARFLQSFCENWPILDTETKLTLVYQKPVNFAISDIFDSCKEIPVFDHSQPLPMVQLRRHGLDLVEDCEYICTLDDDHQFVGHREGKLYPKSSFEFYQDAIKFMDDNPKVGVMSLRGYFGGVAWGYEPKINPANGLFENNAGGLLMRNIGKEKIFPTECHNFVGVLSEPLMAYNIINEGYNCAKKFNCPNKFEVPGKSKHVGENSKISYSEEVSNANVQGYIRKKFDDPTWRHSDKKYPKKIAIQLGYY